MPKKNPNRPFEESCRRRGGNQSGRRQGLRRIVYGGCRLRRDYGQVLEGPGPKRRPRVKGSAPDPGWRNGIIVNREGVLHTAGFAVTNVRTSSFPVKASKSMCANVARPSRRASSKSVHGIRSLNDSRSLEVVATLAFLQHHFA